MPKLSSVGNSCTVSSVRLQVPAAPQQWPCLSAHPGASKSCHKGHRGSETLRRELRSVPDKYAFWVGKHRTTWGASCKLFSRKGRFIPSRSSTGTQAWQPFSTRRADVPRSRKLKWGGCEAPGSPSWRKAKVAAPAAVWHWGLISFPCPLPLHSWQRELIKIRNHLVIWTNSLQCFRCFQKGSGSTADAMVKSVPSELGTYTTCSERKEQRKNPLAQATVQQCKLLPRLNAKGTQTSPGQKDVTGREQNTAAAPSSAALPSMGTFQSSSAWICTTRPALASCWHRAGFVHQTTRAPKGPILPLLGPGKTHTKHLYALLGSCSANWSPTQNKSRKRHTPRSSKPELCSERSLHQKDGEGGCGVFAYHCIFGRRLFWPAGFLGRQCPAGGPVGTQPLRKPQGRSPSLHAGLSNQWLHEDTLEEQQSNPYL